MESCVERSICGTDDIGTSYNMLIIMTFLVAHPLSYLLLVRIYFLVMFKTFSVCNIFL